MSSHCSRSEGQEGCCNYIFHADVKKKVLFGIMVLWGIRYTVHSIKAKTFGIN